MRVRAASFFIATRLRRVRSKLFAEERLTEPWLQAAHFPTCAANSKQSGGITGKIRSTRFDGISDIATRPPTLQQSSQNVSGDRSRNAVPILHRRDATSKTATAIISTLQGANLCSRCGI